MKDLSLYERMDLTGNGFPAKILTLNKCKSILPHWHEHLELNLFLKGRGEVFCDGNRICVEKGGLTVSNSSQIHSVYSERGVGFHALIVSPDLFSDIDFKDIVIQNHIKNDEFIIDCFTRMVNEYDNYKIGSDMVIKSLVYSLFAHLVRNYSTRSPEIAETHRAHLKRLDKVFNYISEFYNEDITSKTLAEMTYLTESYFCRFFKSITGLTVANYLSQYRVEKACYLLKKTDASISEISENVGFTDQNYFARVFKKIMGTSPTEYRKGL